MEADEKEIGEKIDLPEELAGVDPEGLVAEMWKEFVSEIAAARGGSVNPYRIIDRHPEWHTGIRSLVVLISQLIDRGKFGQAHRLQQISDRCTDFLALSPAEQIAKRPAPSDEDRKSLNHVQDPYHGLPNFLARISSINAIATETE